MAGGLLTALLVTRIGWVVLSVTLALFVIGTMTGLLFEQARRRSGKTGDALSASVRQVVTGDGAFWSGQLSHCGVALIAIGMAFAANLGTHLEVGMSPGESTVFQGHTITYESPFQQSSTAVTVIGARLTVTDGTRLVAVMEPSFNLFGDQQSAVGTPDVLHTARGDIYVTLRDFPDETMAIRITLDTSPMIWILWLGGLVTVTGGLLSVRARRRERRVAVDRPTVDV
jgi:cytochrome c-type biogenesis protein CcmF